MKMDETLQAIPDPETFKGILAKYRTRIRNEVHSLNDLMSLLMKGTQRKWTKGEIKEIKFHLMDLSKNIPAIMVFLLPGGLILLPVLVELLDRRQKALVVPEDRRMVEEKREKE